MRTISASLTVASTENDDNVNDASHTINLSLLLDFGTNQKDVKVEEQSKVILKSLPFSEFLFF